jgi:uncharacterized repeat protein (TIGR01451 family)
VDAAGNLYIADDSDIDELSFAGDFALAAGSGASGIGDGGAATSAELLNASGVAVDPFGNLFISDSGNQRIRRVSAGIISTVAGGASGDAVAVPFATFLWPSSMVEDHSGNIYISDGTPWIHMIGPSGSISTVAGTGVSGYSGDNGPATAARLSTVSGLAVDSNGALYIADSGNNRIRKVSGEIITTVAGNGSPLCPSPFLPALSLCYPQGIAIDSLGNLYIADSGNHRILQMAPGGTVTTVAGNGYQGYSGDDGPATSAQLNFPGGIAVDAAGNLYLADTGNNSIRKVNSKGVITTVAGSGIAGFAGDDGAATAARLNSPASVALDSAGNLYIADQLNNRIRAVAASGIITTVAGNGVSAYAGDGSLAVDASLSAPKGVTVGADGNIYIADLSNRAIRVLTLESGPALLTVLSTHSGEFGTNSPGQYTLTVSNAALAGATAGTVTVTEFIPEGMTLSSMAGPGWTCSGSTCTCTDPLSGGVSYPPITVTVNVSSTAPAQVTNQVTVMGGGSPLSGVQDLTVLSPSVTLQTNPPGLLVSEDGLPAQTAPQTFRLSPGPHTIAVPTPQGGAPGTQYVFTGWSDAGAASHAITVGSTASAYTANFKTQYQLTTTALPTVGGSLTPPSGQFFDAGSNVTVTATPVSPFVFGWWSGASGTWNPALVAMNGAKTVTANLVTTAFSCDINGDGATDNADVQIVINEALGLIVSVSDLNHDTAVNILDVQKEINATLQQGCVY